MRPLADRMVPPKARLLFGTLGLTLLAAALAAAQSAPEPVPAAAKADMPMDAPSAAAKVAPAPVKYTELKKTLWPPKAGVKTPGVQIPITSLKPEAEIPLAAPAGPILFTTDQVLIPIPSGDQILRVEGKSNKVLDPFSGISKPCG